MKIRKYFLFFVGALFHSWLEIIVAVVILGFAFCWLHISSSNSQVNQGSSLFIGVVSSLVATLFLNISSKFNASCRAHGNIIDTATKMYRWVEINKKYFYRSILPRKDFRFQLYQFYFEICKEAQHLSYQKDFFQFSNAVNLFIENLSEPQKETDFKQIMDDFQVAIHMFE